MKKGLISITALAMVLGVGVAVGAHQAKVAEVDAVAKDTVIYLDVSGGDWFADSAKVAFWNHQGSCFDEFTSDSESGLYKATLSTECTSFNLFRGSALNWDDKWNQGDNDTFVEGKNLIKSLGYDGSKLVYSWDVYTPKSDPSSETNTFYVYDRSFVFGDKDHFSGVNLYGFGQADNIKPMNWPGSHNGLTTYKLGDTDVYKAELSTSYPKFIINGNSLQTRNVEDLEDHIGDVFVIGSVIGEGDDAGKYDGYWLEQSEFTDIPAEDGYYIRGFADWSYSAATRMTDDTVGENIAHYTGLSAKAGDKIRVSSFFSDRFPYNNWATLGGESWGDWGEKSGDDFKFLKDGTNYNVYAKYESTEFKFYVGKIDAYEITMNAVLWNGGSKDTTESLSNQTAYSDVDFEPVTPLRSGYAIRGVYYDEACTLAYTPKKFTAADELYVKYTKVGYYVISELGSWSIDQAVLMNTAGIAPGNKAETTIVVTDTNLNKEYAFVYYEHDGEGGMTGSAGLGATYSYAEKGSEDDNNVKFTKKGTYAVYFSNGDNKIYLNEGSIAFCSGFLVETGKKCDEYGKTTDTDALKVVWGEQKALYNDLSAAAQKEITDVGFDGGKEDGTEQEKFMARYAYIIKKYGSAEFENFVFPTAAAIAPGSLLGQIDYGMNNTDSTALIAIVSVIAIASISAVAVLVVAKKRKHQ